MVCGVWCVCVCVVWCLTVLDHYEDPNAPGTIAAAWAGGMSHVDFYM